MSSRVKNVSIDLRNLDGVILERESQQEDGEHRTRRTRGPAMEEVLKMHEKATHRWNTLFIVVCAFAVFIDPLFCYIYVTREDYMCFDYDWKLLLTYICLRTGVDVFYIIDIIIFLKGVCKKHKGKSIETSYKVRNDRRTVLALKEGIKKGYLLSFSILPRILVSLPIPEGLVGLNLLKVYFDPIYVILIITPFQYTLRIFLVYGSQRWHPIKKTATGRWLKPLLDFLPFILASHLYGALWYRLAVQRQIDCWRPYCAKFQGYQCKSIESFECSYGTDRYNPRLQELCPTIVADPKVFDFGIYLYAFQSHMTGSSSLPRKLLLSFWWALRNLSSFGSNLLTSMDTLEIFFSVAMSISGMALFLVYLNARVEESRARSRQLKLNERKHVMNPDIDLWLSKNDLCNLTTSKPSKDLKSSIKNRKALKTVIIENINKLEEHKDIDVRNIISILPIKYKRSIIRLLCLASLKKVPVLAHLNATILKVICEHLKPVVYTEDNCIVQEGKPLGIMFFITQGLAWSYTTNNDNAGGSSSPNKWLKRGDFYGEELLNCVFKCPSFTDLPFSDKTVVSQEKVEAFALRASDLKGIVCKFWWHFTRELKQADLKQWENSAASSIQGAWRNRLARKRRSNCWDKFTVGY